MKYFIDCGGHFGEGLKHFADSYRCDKNWKIFTFEPNKESFDILKKVTYKDVPITCFNLGIWTEDTKLYFNPETSPSGETTGAGSTFVKKEDWNIKIPGNTGAGDYKDKYEIEVIDFSKFLKELKNPEFVLVKMDIEGSEYAVLRSLIADGSIGIINEIHCEFHDWAMKSENKESTKELINQIEQLGVKINKWI